MIKNKDKNRTKFCLEQARAFVDYSSKFRICSKDELLSIFCRWRDSKKFLEEDGNALWELVEEFWLGKEKQISALKCEKCRSENRDVEADKKQLEFEFVSKCSDKNGKKK